jgi:hypothetical protein
MFKGMVDMGQTPEEIKKDVSPMPAMEAPSAPTYPYGLCISLTENELEKLGLEGDMPEIGELVHLMGMAKVTSVSEHERELPDGTKKRCCRVELQIVALKAEDEDEEDPEERRERSEARDKARSSAMYDDEEEDAEV